MSLTSLYLLFCWTPRSKYQSLPLALAVYTRRRESERRGGGLITDVIIYSRLSFVVYLCNEYLMVQLLPSQSRRTSYSVEASQLTQSVCCCAQAVVWCGRWSPPLLALQQLPAKLLAILASGTLIFTSKQSMNIQMRFTQALFSRVQLE